MPQAPLPNLLLRTGGFLTAAIQEDFIVFNKLYTVLYILYAYVNTRCNTDVHCHKPFYLPSWRASLILLKLQHFHVSPPLIYIFIKSCNIKYFNTSSSCSTYPTMAGITVELLHVQVLKQLSDERVSIFNRQNHFCRLWRHEGRPSVLLCCWCSSATYLLNNIPSDRYYYRHKKKGCYLRGS